MYFCGSTDFGMMTSSKEIDKETDLEEFEEEIHYEPV
jgi:hypothetical protein